MRFAPVMLALLLALSPVAVAVQASAPAASTASPVEQTNTSGQTVNENTTAVLTLGSEPQRTAFDSPSASLGSSLSGDRSEVRTQLDTKTLDQQLEAAESSEKKQQILTQYRYQIENRIISLKAQERQAASEFSNGSISATEYARTLGRIDAEAEEVRRSIRVLNERVGSVPNFGMPGVERTLKGKLVSLEGPIRDRISNSLRGESDPVRIHITTAESGVVLTMITDRHYVRESYREDHRDASVSGSMSRENGETQVIEPQYPWVTDNSPYAEQSAYTSIQTIQYFYQHTHGNLTAYVDTGTEQVFREIQYKSLSSQQSLPPGPGVQNTTSTAFGSENVTLTVNRTYAGGPLRVQLANETGAPLDSQITVGGEPVGQTGSDGVLWTLSPADQFRVSATYEGTTINQTVTAMELDYDSSED